MTPAVALTIAGSDSSGGAGIQADLKTFAALGVHGASAVTALTAQNTRGVRAVHAVPADFVVAQVEAVLDDLTVAAVKTGMLATADIVRAVADLAAAGRLPNLVVDPVMVASSGDRLLEPQAERLYRAALLPHASVVTPNLHEAEVLLGTSIRTRAQQHEAARALGALGPSVVVVKGGHAVRGSADCAVDVVWDGVSTYELRAARVDTANNHGTGCTFASAIAAALAQGADVPAALGQAKGYLTRAIRGGAPWQLGRGHGPVDHFGWTSR
ncbi:MAG: bifunctional hydroxymethylpyrimidine kinase/phosphomethylpyrimidine kinase [Actinomycetota bacterium]|nr:bifunctional hydroxymethylpyrimidine kinase/phosphomethylpyrimidine kinase [Actinomycetota bacterium]